MIQYYNKYFCSTLNEAHYFYGPKSEGEVPKISFLQMRQGHNNFFMMLCLIQDMR